MGPGRTWSGLLLAGIVMAAGTAGASAASAASTAEPSPAEVEGRLMLVLDSSGSMKEPAADGRTKIAAAKDALRDVVRRLPDGAQVGLRVYGATVFDRSERGACTDSQNVVPVGPLDRNALTSAISQYRPYGETPIGYALQEAAKDLGSEGKRTIVLLSDGEPTCDPDPCEVARDLRKQGVGLTVNVVGLDVSGKARRELQCIAEAGRGTYYDAADAQELAGSLVSVSVRALREFTVQGMRVQGTPTPASAPEIATGQYVDTIGGYGSTNHYLIRREPGETVWAGVTARPPENDVGFDRDGFSLDLTTPRGKPCADSYGSGGTRLDTLGGNSIVSAGVVYNPQNEGGLTDASCPDSRELVLTVTRGTESSDSAPQRGNIDYELLVGAHPKVADVAALPPPVEDVAPYVRRAPFRGPVEPVVGGGSFGDAPELTSGVYADTIRPGEQLLYAVPLKWGQSLRFTARLGPTPLAGEQLGAQGDPVDVTAFSPRRTPLSVSDNFDTEPAIEAGAFYNGDEPASVTAALPPVRYRNNETFDQYVDPVRTAGTYYVALQLSEFRGETPYAAPVTLAVAVDGRPQGAPTYADHEGAPAATEEATTSPGGNGPPTADATEGQRNAGATAEADEGVSGGAVALGALAAVLLLGALGGLFLRRRRP